MNLQHDRITDDLELHEIVKILEKRNLNNDELTVIYRKLEAFHRNRFSPKPNDFILELDLEKIPLRDEILCLPPDEI